MTPVWAQLGYLVAAVCFIVALKGLSSPRTARRGNLIGAIGAVLACVIVFLSSDLDHLGWILIAVAVGTVIGALGAYRVRMTQMPQLVALFNGVGGAAAAIVALVELEAVSRVGSAPAFDLIATAFTIVVGSVSFTGSVVTFLKLQELMTGRPITFAGYPILYGFALVSAIGLRHRARPGADAGAGSGAGPDRRGCRGPARAARRRRRRTHRHLAAERLHRPVGGGQRLRPGQHAAVGGGHAGRGRRHAAHPADGHRHGSSAGVDAVRGAARAAPPWAAARSATGR